MIEVNVAVREVRKLKPDYSLKFSLPQVPSIGDYISIRRPDKPEPYGEDMIVRAVWWRLFHPETRPSVVGEDLKIGEMTEVFVECEPAIGPHSSDDWRQYLERAGSQTSLDIDRFSVRESEMKGGNR